MPKILKAENIQTDLIGSNGNNAFSLQRNNSSLLTLSTAERVGIGTTSPGYRLTVQTSSGTESQLGLVTTSQAINTGAELQMDLTNASNSQFEGGSILVRHTSSNQTANAENAYMVFQTRNSGIVAERLRIDNNGNIGIGTAGSASARLHVVSDQALIGIINSTSTLGPSISFRTNNTQRFVISTQAAIQGSGTDYSACIFSEGNLNFSTGGTASPVLVIRSTGNVGINTTPNASTMFHAAATQSAITPGFFQVSALSSTATPGVTIEKRDNDSTTAQIFMSFNHNAGVNGCGGIQGNGSNGVQFFSSSDIRLKENISDLDPQLNKILMLKPRKFDFIDGKKNCIGFIAQEIEEVFPDVVGSSPDGYKTVGGISIIESRLIKAIQELKYENDNLKARITALEQK